MWWNVGPHLERRRKVESGLEAGWPISPGRLARKTSSYFQRDTDIQELIDILRAKYGTLTRAWRVALDADASGILDFREFSQALQTIGYVGNMRTLWFNLDDDQSGGVSLKEIDPEAYQSLEKFRVLAGRQYGGIVNCWHQLLDADKSGTVGLEEFHEACLELGYDDEDEEAELFGYLLITPGIRYITIHDVKFLQTWEDTKNATAFRSRLRKGWVNKDPYQRMSMSKAGSVSGGLTANPSMTTLGASTAADASAVDYGSIIMYDPEQSRQAFRKHLVERFGTLCEGFDAIDMNGSGSLSLTEFQAVVSGTLRYCRPADAARLFLSFNQDPAALLTWDELGILKHEWVTHLTNRNVIRLRRAAEKCGGESGTPKLGASPRQNKSHAVHMDRLRPVQKPKEVAFGMPLPTGWGFPPYFSPRAGRQVTHQVTHLPPLSAR